MILLRKAITALLCIILFTGLPARSVYASTFVSSLFGNTVSRMQESVEDFINEVSDNTEELAEEVRQSLDLKTLLKEQWDSLVAGSAASTDALNLDTFKDLEDGFRYVKSIEDMELRGKSKVWYADVGVYEYTGAERKEKWEGYPYLYQLYDKDRKLCPVKAVKQKRLYNNLLTSGRLIYFSPEEQCPYYEEVDAYHSVRCAYDYYADHYHWFGPDGSGRTPVFVVTEVEKSGNGDTITNTTAADTEEGNAAIFVGLKSGAADDLELIMHEYTHLVMTGKGKHSTTMEGAAVEEGYADVMAVCAFSDDWYFGANKTVRKLTGDKKTLYNKEDYDRVAEQFSNWLDLSHLGAMILGHAAFLMNEDFVSEKLFPGQQVGEKLTKEQIALLFYRSMDYLDENYDFDDAGKAILQAAYDLNQEYGISGNGMENGGLSDDQIVRIREALESCGISSDWTPGNNLPWLDDSEEEKTPEIEIIETDPVVVGPQPDDELLLRNKAQELISEYGILSTKTLKGTKRRTSNELSGLMNVFMKDLDDDGAPELLVNRFDVTAGSLYFNMGIYEVFGNDVVLQDEKRLRVPWLTEEMYSFSSSIAGFLFCRKNEGYHIAVETYEAFDGSVLTLAVFRYDGSCLIFENAGCFLETGEGSLSVRTADSEGECVLNGADEEASEWETVCSFDAGSYEANDLYTVVRPTCLKGYAAIFTGPGIKIGNDVRLQGLPVDIDPMAFDYDAFENRRFTQDMKTVYAGTLVVTPLWRIASWNKSGELQLVRTDYEDSLR